MSKESLRITSDYSGYETRYPDLLELSNKQFEKQIWFASKIRVVEEDRMEMLYSLTEEQQEVVKRILPTFRKYEIDVSKFWTDVYPKFFKAPECQEAAAVVNVMELAVHARFYDKINKVFGTDNDEHYLSYLNDPIFKDRAKWLGETLRNPDKKLVCMVYSLVEGVSLFSLFALLRSFQANGYNKIATTVKGTKQSAIDELLHSEILTKSFNYYYAELGMDINDDTYYVDKLKEQALNTVAMEEFILTSLIPSGIFNGVPLSDYFDLIKMLVNVLFIRFGIKDLLYPEIKSCKLYDWFLTSSVAYAEPDFFSKGENKEYEHSWDEDGFVKCWKNG